MIIYIKAVKDATYNGLKTAGEDVFISDWSKENQEIMESFEIEDNGTIYPIKAFRNLEVIILNMVEYMEENF